MNTIVAEKVGLAIEVLNALDIDMWLTFVRETGESGDPMIPLILGQSLTWQSALMITRGGDRIAIVGKYDDQAVSSTGVWTQTIPDDITPRNRLVLGTPLPPAAPRVPPGSGGAEPAHG